MVHVSMCVSLCVFVPLDCFTAYCPTCVLYSVPSSHVLWQSGLLLPCSNHMKAWLIGHLLMEMQCFDSASLASLQLAAEPSRREQCCRRDEAPKTHVERRIWKQDRAGCRQKELKLGLRHTYAVKERAETINCYLSCITVCVQSTRWH